MLIQMIYWLCAPGRRYTSVYERFSVFVGLLVIVYAGAFLDSLSRVHVPDMYLFFTPYFVHFCTYWYILPGCFSFCVLVSVWVCMVGCLYLSAHSFPPLPALSHWPFPSPFTTHTTAWAYLPSGLLLTPCTHTHPHTHTHTSLPCLLSSLQPLHHRASHSLTAHPSPFSLSLLSLYLPPFH